MPADSLPAAVNPAPPKSQAMVLAAGRGERMRPLTDHTPKPLLAVRGQPLMQWPMQALARGGFTRLLVNTDWLGGRIEAHFGLQPSPMLRDALSNQEQIQIQWSREGLDFGGALETLGGISRALPHLDDVFRVVAGDVFTPEFVFAREAVDRLLASGRLGHLWLVPNPPHNPRGDFGLEPSGLALSRAATQYTFSTVGLYRRSLFEAPHCPIPPGNPAGTKAPLAPLLRAAMDNQLITAELYTGPWTDVGTPERLAQLNAP